MKKQKVFRNCSAVLCRRNSNLNDIKNGEKRNLFIETTGANKGIIVENKITFEVIDVP